MPWLLVVGGQVQGNRLCVRDEGCWWWSAVRCRATGNASGMRVVGTTVIPDA